ncbi:DNA polymerase III subunit delta [Candidatus Pelagibacter sp.]|uniref:DNA polymerase III subunit delta n=1 Tax=Candidatus Pelagibacter sp. TaxID=2024849 RepID=UPI003F848444
MISKHFEIGKFREKTNFFLFYGENEGLKSEIIETHFKNFNKKNTHRYTEKEIIANKEIFFESIYSKSFFENEKLILISDVTDRTLNIIEEVIETKIEDEVFILLAKRLEKKSKIRNFFEKDERTLTIPFYEDTSQTLVTIARKVLNENKINLSQENLNLIVERAQGDRINLKNELQKIISLSQNNKKIELEDILKLTNLSENYSAGELVDNCLSKNKKRTLNILNENIPSSEDNILILRTFLIKLKRLRKLRLSLKENNNIDQVINSFKPPIFWKDKNIIKQQIKIWELNDIESFIEDLNNTETLIKRNPQISNQIINNMILDKIENTNTQI